MSKRVDVIKKQSPEDWKWAGTTITSLICSEMDYAEFLEICKKKIEKAGMEILDLHIFKWDDQVYNMVNIQFLIRPKQNEFLETASGYVL